MARTMAAVEGAAAVLEAAVTAASPRQAAQRLRDTAAGLDLRDARAATVAEGRSVVLATHPTGAALALRWFPPGAPTTIHRHGSWGAALVVDGRDRYERFELDHGVANLDATLWLEAGDIVWWLDPPHDIHRQAGLDAGALELIVVGTAPADDASAIPEGDALGSARGLVDALRRAYEARSFEPLGAHYAHDVIADVCVPAWRFQLRGRDALGELLANEELGLPDQRLQSFRSFPVIDGCVAEVAVRFNHHGETRLWRDIHLLRSRDGQVVEHLAYCTGHWDAATIARHDAEAPMVRP